MTETTSSSLTNSTSTFQAAAPGGVGHSFMAVLSSKLIGTSSSAASSGGSPKSARKHINAETASSKASRGPTSFLESLNAKLAHQQQPQQQQQQQQPQPQIIATPPQVATSGAGARSNNATRSASVRRIMGNRAPIIDPSQVRDSLMDQIRRGTSLRKTSGPINDRSAPQIY